MTSRIKSLLTPFYKLAHPDVLRQAPEQIQKANSLALSTLNSYIDSVVQGEKVMLNSLRFYVMHKNDYSECKVTLLPLKSQATQNIKDLHLESVVNSINQAIANPEDMIEEKEIRLTPKRFRMRDEYFASSTSQIRNHVAREFKIKEREGIIKSAADGIEREYNSAHPSSFGLKSRKSNIFIQEALESSVAKTQYRSLESISFPIQKLFIDEVLSNDQIDKGLENLSGIGLPHEEMKDFRGIIGILSESTVGLAISTRYSAKNVPGFLQVPFDFKFSEFSDFFRKNKNIAEEGLLDYTKFAKKTDKAMRYISELIVPCTLARYIFKNQEKYESQTFAEGFAASKNLLRLIETHRFPRGIKDVVLIFGKEYLFDKGFIQIPCNFTEQQLIAWLETKIKINQ